MAESTFFETKEIREQILDTKDPVIPPVVLVGNKLDLVRFIELFFAFIVASSSDRFFPARRTSGR